MKTRDQQPVIQIVDHSHTSLLNSQITTSIFIAEPPVNVSLERLKVVIAESVVTPTILRTIQCGG